jgi:hypothetical protein
VGGAVAGGGFFADGVGQELIGVDAQRDGVGVGVGVQPALELRAVDLGVELDGQVAADSERLNGDVVAGQHGRGGGWQAAVVVELQPGAGRDHLGVGRLDYRPADLQAVHGLHPAAEGGA